MADFTVAGDHAGFLPSSSAPKPATCGAAMEVPDMKPNLAPSEPIGETPARTATPGAATSGFSRSESVASSGPREENPAICGWASSGRPVVSLLTRETLMAGLAVTLSLMVSAGGRVHVDGGDRVLVRVQRGVAQVDQDHADAAAALDLGALGDAVNDAAVTDDNLAGDLGRVERAGAAEGGVAAARAAAALAASTTPASVTSRFMMLAPRNLVPSENSTVPCEFLGEAAGGHRGDPRCAVVHGAGGGAGVAG